MKNRTIAKLLVCSTILANLPVAAMANEVQQLAEDVNKWTDDQQGNWTYTLKNDTTLWGNESGTYTLASDSTYKIVFDANVKNVSLDSNVAAVETNDTTSKLTIEGKSAAESNFNLNGYTITGDVSFKNVNVVGTVDRANTAVDNTVTVNGAKVVSVHAGEGVELAENAGVFFKNSDKGTGFALVGEQVAVNVLEGYELAGGNTVTVADSGDGTMTIVAQKAEQSVWVPQTDGSYVLDTSKLAGMTALEVPASTATTTYTIPAGTVLDVTNVTVGKGSILRVEQGATFTQSVDFVLGGRLIAQTTNFKGQAWFSAPKVREASATTDGTAELTGATTVNAGVSVASGVALTISGTVEGQGSITSQGDLTVSGTVSTPVVVEAGTTNIVGTAKVPSITVTGPASVTVAATATVDGDIVITETAGNTAKVEAPGKPVEDNRPNSMTYTVSVIGKGTLNYGDGVLTNQEDTTITKDVYTVADDTDVQLLMKPADGYALDSLKINGVVVQTTRDTQGFDTYSVKKDTNLKSVVATFASTGGGAIGGIGGGGSTGGSSTTNTTTTVTVSSSSSVSGTTMKSTVSAANMEKAVKDVLELAKKNNTNPVVKVALGTASNIENIVVELPTEALKALAAVSNAKLTVESGVASVTFDAAALSDILSQAGETFTLNAGKADMSKFTAAQLLGAGEGSVFDINIVSGDKTITNFDGGSATVTLPYALKSGESSSDIVVYYMADNGILDSCSTTYNAETKKATFTTGHFSIYVVDAAWANPFNDVYEGAWFYNAVRYANENNLMSGVSDTTFAPNMKLTRAMVVQMLYSLEGKPAAPAGGFMDVKESDWYADAVNWAASKGIVSGYSDTTYAPNDSVTREQLSLILYKYAQSKNVAMDVYGSLGEFVDGVKTADWAEDAVEWAIGAGLISSTSTDVKTLDPNGTATRAQVAQIFANFVEQVM